LGAIRLTTAIFAPSHFCGIGAKMQAGNMMMDANLGTTQARKEAFGLIGASAIL
jgi:hypothetical protein